MKPMNAMLTAEKMEILRRLDGCTVANAIERFQQRLRNEGFADNSIRCLFPNLAPMLGYAAIVKIRGSAPLIAAGMHGERTDWWDYVSSLPAPRVVVVQDMASKPGLGSLLGVVHVNILRALDCAGAVTNGAVRGLPVAKKLGFHLFAGRVSVSHAYMHIIEFGTSVEVGGLKVRSGDLLHGDLHGVQSIPLELAGKLPAVAAEIVAGDQELIMLGQSKDFSLEKLRSALGKTHR
jgi:regulator of RNase E activity RraA